MDEDILVTIPVEELQNVFKLELQKADYILEVCEALEKQTNPEDRAKLTELIGGLATALQSELTNLVDIFDGPLDTTRVTHLLAIDPDAPKH